MKKIVCLLLVIISIFSLSACGGNSESSLLTSENKDKLFPDGSKIENLRLNSMDYSQFKSNNEGFNLVGSSKDKEESDYILKQMNEIGLKNVKQVPITLDGWKLGDISLTFKCECMETGYMNIYDVGVYPCDFSFKGEKYQVLYVDSLLNYNESLIDKGVLIETDKNKEMFFYVLLSVLRDIMMAGRYGKTAAIQNVQIADKIYNISDRIDYHKASKCIIKVNDAWRLLQKNVNYKLATDMLAVRLQEVIYD